MTTDQRAHLAPINEAITANLGPWEAYKPDDVPSTRPDIYVVSYLSRRPVFVGRINVGSGVTGWRLTTRYVGQTFDMAEWALARTTEALENQSLTVESGAGGPGNGLFPLDGINDPWRWAPDGPWWVGPAYEVTWLAGDELPVPDLPVGGEAVQLTITDLTTYLATRGDLGGSQTYSVSSGDSSNPFAADGTGIAFLAQAQPGYSDVMNEPPNPELDVTTMLGDVTLVTGTPEPWQWSSDWGGWVGPAYELTWLTGDTITPADIDLNYRVIVIEDPAPDAPDDSTYLTGWTTTHGLAPIVATADGSGVGYVIQHEPGFTHTEVPDDALDPATMFGDFTVGAEYVFPDFATGNTPYPWPGEAAGATTIDTTTPIQFETEQPIAYDDGWYSGATSWTYVL